MMNNREVLEKAIQKAIDGGWGEPELDAKLIATDCFRLGGWHLNQVIYDKSFAEALWGKETTTDGVVAKGMDEDYGPAWQYHLQQMVIAPDPIQYLGDNL